MSNEAVVFKLGEGAFPPIRAYEADAGADLRSPIDVVVPARGSAVIDTGVHIEIAYGFCGMLKSKSGLNVKHGILSEGVIDAGYTGSIVAKLYNLSDKDYQVRRGDKITQLVLMPCVTGLFTGSHGAFGGTERGAGGFGSTGR